MTPCTDAVLHISRGIGGCEWMFFILGKYFFRWFQLSVFLLKIHIRIQEVSFIFLSAMPCYSHKKLN